VPGFFAAGIVSDSDPVLLAPAARDGTSRLPSSSSVASIVLFVDR
jgi:hypothetical protein